MTLTPEQKAAGWIEWNGGECPIKDERTTGLLMLASGYVWDEPRTLKFRIWNATGHSSRIIAYRIIKAHGADAAPARPTPFPASYDELVFNDDGWSQTIIVDGKRPEWLRDDDECTGVLRRKAEGWRGRQWTDDEIAIRVRRREPKRETVKISVEDRLAAPRFQLFGTIDLIDGKPDLSTLKIGGDA